MKSDQRPLNNILREIRADAVAQGFSEEQLRGLTASRARGLAGDGRLTAEKLAGQWIGRLRNKARIARELGVPLQDAEPAAEAPSAVAIVAA